VTWDKLGDLAKIQQQGKQRLAEYEEHAQRKAQAEMELAGLDREVNRIDEQMANLIPLKPSGDRFATMAELRDWKAQTDDFRTQRMHLMRKRLALGSNIATERTTMINLLKEIEGLRRSQRNLEEVAAGRNPASGWEGGVFRVM
jgi:hypothetical protein